MAANLEDIAALRFALIRWRSSKDPTICQSRLVRLFDTVVFVLHHFQSFLDFVLCQEDMPFNCRTGQTITCAHPRRRLPLLGTIVSTHLDSDIHQAFGLLLPADLTRMLAVAGKFRFSLPCVFLLGLF